MMYNNNFIKYSINNKDFYSVDNQTILQVCIKIGIDIPRYCYHDKLSIAGNCRMCLVEVFGIQKPVVSCAHMVSVGSVIYTNSEMVRRIREGISQFLLSNHPLDCAICDQAGECDLQDQVLFYGTDKGKFFDYKRTNTEKEFGPLIKTVMSRCIQCTRCVRFFDEICGEQVIGLLGRGQTMEVSGYIDILINSEISGNVIDLCPVGALTSKPFAFVSRAWELRSYESIDVFDSIGSNIRVDVGFSRIVKIVPLLNEHINEEWITDKIRFSFDGLSKSRIYSPMIMMDGSFSYVDWESILFIIFQVFGLNFVGNKNVIFSTFNSKELGIESLFFSRFLTNFIGFGSVFSDYKFTNFVVDFVNDYVFNDFDNIFRKVDRFFFIGLNLKLESPILNLYIRRRVLETGLDSYLVGTYFKSTFPLVHLSFSLLHFYFLLVRTDFINGFKNDRRILFLFNENIVDFIVCKKIIHFLRDSKWNYRYYCKVLSNISNSIGWNDLNMGFCYNHLKTFYYDVTNIFKYIENNYFKYTFGFSYGISLYHFCRSFLLYLSRTVAVRFFKIKVLFLNSINNNLLYNFKYNSNFIIYQGIFGNDFLLYYVDILLPIFSFLEKKSYFKNIFNKIQNTSNVILNSSFTRDELEFFKVFFYILIYFRMEFCCFRFYSFKSFFFNFIKNFNINKNILDLLSLGVYNQSNNILSNYVNVEFDLNNSFFFKVLYNTSFDDYYNTNLICFNSDTLLNCSKNLTYNYNYYMK